MHTLALLDSSLTHSLFLSLLFSFPYFPIFAPNILFILAVKQRTSCYFFFLPLRRYKTMLPMYRVYETCKANETQSGHIVLCAINRKIVILLDQCLWCKARGGAYLDLIVLTGFQMIQIVFKFPFESCEQHSSIRTINNRAARVCEARKNFVA